MQPAGYVPVGLRDATPAPSSPPEGWAKREVEAPLPETAGKAASEPVRGHRFQYRHAKTTVRIAPIPTTSARNRPAGRKRIERPPTNPPISAPAIMAVVSGQATMP